jgi:hypothetical protein
MASNKWDVQGALYEVVRAIQDGSSLSITGLEDGYKRRFQPDFQTHWNLDDDAKPGQHSWPLARERVLKLAEMVGSLATTLCIYRAWYKKEPIPRTVDQFSAYFAGHLVANTVCPIEGAWCMSYDKYKENLQPDFELSTSEFGSFLQEINTLLDGLTVHRG